MDKTRVEIGLDLRGQIRERIQVWLHELLCRRGLCPLRR